MASFVEYRENAAACARLARIAPSERGRASFAAAAKHWAALYRLAAGNSTGVDCSVATWPKVSRGPCGFTQAKPGPHRLLVSSAGAKLLARKSRRLAQEGKTSRTFDHMRDNARTFR
jgi:hypothetical protein